MGVPRSRRRAHEACVSGTTIAKLTATPLDIPLTEPFAIAKGAPSVASNVLVQIELTSGAVGLGEAAPFTAVSGETQKSSLAAIESARSWLVGSDVHSFRSLSARLAEALVAEPAARCALEVAVLDALTRQHGIPLYAFFGGSGTDLQTDMTIPAGTAEQAAAAAKAIEARGITTLKVKVGARSPVEDAERLRAVHRAVPAARLLADANGGYAPTEARAFLEALSEMEVPLELFEQPVEPDAWLDFVRSTPMTGVLLCADESVRSAGQLLRLVREDAIDVVNIKPMKSSVLESIAIWHMARVSGVKLMIGGMLESSLAMSFSAHLAAGLGGFSYVDLDTPMFMADHPFVGGFEQTGALLSVARVESGHGVTIRKS
jgi:L-alanine-DL-glutamate epimerase-like enolase superfamily enzyme